MVRHITLFLCFFSFCLSILTAQDKLIYHDIKTDANGNIIPWFSPNLGESYDKIMALTWHFWINMRKDENELPYYMNHQVWEKDFNDKRGIGGDQLQMALSAWRLYYAYTGNEAVKKNMIFMADYYISHSISSSTAMWPNLPYPYNTSLYDGIYDGDMVLGKGYTQPDKAGSFGYELVNLYKMTRDKKYLNAAIKIANTLASKTTDGDSLNSPMPFKVNAENGKVGSLNKSLLDSTPVALSSYTTNWSPTLSLFISLNEMRIGETKSYQTALNKLLKWVKAYPLKNNKWGPFFEDVAGWSDTQINAMTFARFIIEHQNLFDNWENDAQGIIDWVYLKLGNHDWEKYGVTVINEQTSFPVPANSHTARQAADELFFAKMTGKKDRQESAIRQLNWATYMVDHDGKNRFPTIEIWLTDGYGDYIRHYLRAMAALPILSPENENHILNSSSVIQQVEYSNRSKNIEEKLNYITFDNSGNETIRLKSKPNRILLDGKAISQGDTRGDFNWTSMNTGGLLFINRKEGNKIEIEF